MATLSIQLSLFEGINPKLLSAGGFVASMKLALRCVVDKSGLSRAQVVDVMNEVVRATGKGLCKGSKFITLPILEKWLADEERGQLPDLWGMHVLVLATGGNMHPFAVWLSYFECSVLDAVGKDKLEYRSATGSPWAKGLTHSRTASFIPP